MASVQCWRGVKITAIIHLPPVCSAVLFAPVLVQRFDKSVTLMHAKQASLICINCDCCPSSYVHGNVKRLMGCKCDYEKASFFVTAARHLSYAIQYVMGIGMGNKHD